MELKVNKNPKFKFGKPKFKPQGFNKHTKRLKRWIGKA